MIDDCERIARGAYYPSHVDKKNKLTSQIIPKKELFAGAGSVWRLAPKGLTPEQLATRLIEARADPLKKVVSVSASSIRQLRLITGGRTFSLVDETECDLKGGKHPAHAHVAFCSKAKGDATPEDERFLQAHRDLVRLLKSPTDSEVVWQAAKAA